MLHLLQITVARQPSQLPRVKQDPPRRTVPASAAQRRSRSSPPGLPGLGLAPPFQPTLQNRAARQSPADFLYRSEDMAVYEYTKFSSRLNREIRSGNLDRKLQPTMWLIQSAIAKLEAAQGRQLKLLYRGIPYLPSASEKRPDPAEAFVVGEDYIDPAFQSTSIKREVAVNKANGYIAGAGTLMIILTRKGADISALSESGHEGEFLLNTGTRLRTVFSYYDTGDQLHHRFLIDADAPAGSADDHDD
ncbi:MAG: ADP-ribosyltransferase [Janthinobacterium lividum]